MNTIPNNQSPIVNSQSSIVNALIQLDPGATMPTRAHETDVGYDVTALETIAVGPKDGEYPLNTIGDLQALFLSRKRFAYIKIDTGVHVTPPHGYYFELVPNSRLAKTPFSYGNSIGVIDPDYTGSIKVILRCEDDGYIWQHIDKLLPGNVVGQLILRPMLSCNFTQVDHLTPTDRGTGGFGSTATP